MSYKKITSINEFKRLKPRKILPKPENMEWNDGMEYYIYSPRNGTLQKRVFHPMSVDTIRKYIIEETVFLKINDYDTDKC